MQVVVCTLNVKTWIFIKSSTKRWQILNALARITFISVCTDDIISNFDKGYQ